MARVTPVEAAYLDDWSGGTNYESGLDGVKANELPVAFDWKLTEYGELAVRLGREMLTADWSDHPWTDPGTNLFHFKSPADGYHYLITVTADGLVWRSTGGQFGPGVGVAACETAAGQIDLGTINTYPPCHCVLAGRFFLGWGNSYVYYWDGDITHDWVKITDVTLDDSGTEAGVWEFPGVATMCSVFARAWGANTTAYPSRLFWSGAVGTLKEGSADAAGPWNWPASNWVDVNPEDGGKIMRIVPFGQAILIFKEQTTYALVGAGDPTSARLYTVDTSVGCTNPGSVAVGEGKVFWVTSDGAYTYDGSEVRPFGQKLRNYLRAAGITTPHLVQACFFWSGWHISFPDRRLYYDTHQGAWWVLTDGGGGIVEVNESVYTAPDGGGFARLDSAASGYDQSFGAAYGLVSEYPGAYFETGWLPPPAQRDGSQYRLRTIQMGLGRGNDTTNEGRIRVTMIVEGGHDPYSTETVYTYDMADVYSPGRSEASNVMLKVPGSPHLCDRFRIRVELLEASPPTGAVTPVHVNSVTFLFSKRAPKRDTLSVGVPNV